MQEVAEYRMPTRWSSAVFIGKALLLQLQRGLLDQKQGVERHPNQEEAASIFTRLLAESRTPLWTEESAAERRLQLGKVQNLRCALQKLNHTVIPAGGLFSFWKQVGRATRSRGYVEGRQLREGCLYPAIGGGLCQLSNALYDAALQADCEIVERHAHTRTVLGSAAAVGRDAAIAWNYIDLRFRSAQPLLLEASLTRDELVVRLFGQPFPISIQAAPPHPASRREYAPLRFVETSPDLDPVAHSCLSCGAASCFRHRSEPVRAMRAYNGAEGDFGGTAYLVDEYWPEYARHLSTLPTEDAILALPIDGARWRLPRYGWKTAGYAEVYSAPGATLMRSWRSRHVGGEGPARRQAQLDGAAQLAAHLSKALTPEIRRVCIAQTLLPFLWRDGHLGGRTVEVLMTRLPMAVLQERLDAAFARHPDRTQLRDFRAPQWLVDAETQALAAADRIITPHAEIAALFPGRSLLLEWETPTLPPLQKGGTAVAFPGPTHARKGAYELRAVARALDLEVVLLGGELEGDDFWKGVRTRRAAPGGTDRLEGVGVVVQPALVEERPRLLLRALAAGVPVIAAPACGLGERPGVTTIPADNQAALHLALCALQITSPGFPVCHG